MERARHIRNRSHAHRRGTVAAWILGTAAAAWSQAVPFAPAPHLEEKGHARFGMIANHFPTDPVDGDAKERSPWVLKFEAVPFERFGLEATGGDGGAGFGVIVPLYEQEDLGFDLTLGADELFFSTEEHLFGLESDPPSSRVWVGTARSWKWARVSASVAVVPESNDVEYVPFGTAELFLPLDASLGYQVSYTHEIVRNAIGASLHWDPFVIGFGMSELQSWFVQRGEYGFFNESRPGNGTGLDNPGWWFSVAFDLPRKIGKPAPPPPAPKPSFRLDSTDLAKLERAIVERSVRADLAELAMRFSAEGIDPLESGALRRRILSGGAAAKSVLLRIALDTAVTQEERTLAISIAVSRPSEEDLPALESLTEEVSPSLRVETALALRRLDHPRATQLLERLRNDPDAAVRAAATGE